MMSHSVNMQRRLLFDLFLFWGLNGAKRVYANLTEVLRGIANLWEFCEFNKMAKNKSLELFRLWAKRGFELIEPKNEYGTKFYKIAHTFVQLHADGTWLASIKLSNEM